MAKQEFNKLNCQLLHDEGKTDAEIGKEFGETERTAKMMRKYGRRTKHRTDSPNQKAKASPKKRPAKKSEEE